MTAELLALLDELDGAHAKGTADGEWRFVDHRDRFGPDNRFEILDDEGSVAVCSDDNDATESTGLDRVDLIVAAVNSLPKLTAALRAVLAAVDEWERNAGSSNGRMVPRWLVTSVIRGVIADALTPEQVQS